jgi:hypothetical protein
MSLRDKESIPTHGLRWTTLIVLFLRIMRTALLRLAQREEPQALEILERL